MRIWLKRFGHRRPIIAIEYVGYEWYGLRKGSNFSKGHTFNDDYIYLKYKKQDISKRVIKQCCELRAKHFIALECYRIKFTLRSI